MSVLEILSHQALAVLHEAQSPLGTRAASVPMANYQAVFCRDAVVTGLQGLAENDPVRIEGLITSLHTLRKHQGPQGQIPSNVRIEQGIKILRLEFRRDSVSPNAPSTNSHCNFAMTLNQALNSQSRTENSKI